MLNVECHRSEKCAVWKATGFRETVPRNNAKNTVHHRSDGGGSLVANHRRGDTISVTVTRLEMWYYSSIQLQLHTSVTAHWKHMNLTELCLIAVWRQENYLVLSVYYLLTITSNLCIKNTGNKTVHARKLSMCTLDAVHIWA